MAKDAHTAALDTLLLDMVSAMACLPDMLCGDNAAVALSPLLRVLDDAVARGLMAVRAGVEPGLPAGTVCVTFLMRSAQPPILGAMTVYAMDARLDSRNQAMLATHSVFMDTISRWSLGPPWDDLVMANSLGESATRRVSLQFYTL